MIHRFQVIEHIYARDRAQQIKAELVAQETADRNKIGAIDLQREIISFERFQRKLLAGYQGDGGQVASERGILIAYNETLPQKLAERYLFDEQALTVAVEQAIAMTPDETAARGTAARQWFLQNKAGFSSRIARALTEVEGPTPAIPGSSRTSR